MLGSSRRVYGVLLKYINIHFKDSLMLYNILLALSEYLCTSSSKFFKEGTQCTVEASDSRLSTILLLRWAICPQQMDVRIHLETQTAETKVLCTCRINRGKLQATGSKLFIHRLLSWQLPHLIKHNEVVRLRLYTWSLKNPQLVLK